MGNVSHHVPPGLCFRQDIFPVPCSKENTSDPGAGAIATAM